MIVIKHLAIVTGTSRGLGLALANQLLEAEWGVVGLARGESLLQHPSYRHIRSDLGDLAALTELCSQELQPLLADPELERIGLVNNAALIGSLTWLHESEVPALARLLTVNVAAPMYLAAWLVKSAPAEARLRIVNVSSGAAHSPLPGLGDYSATKAALRMAGRTLASELELQGRAPASAAVLSYEPGLVDTAMQDAARGTSPEVFPAHGLFTDFADKGLLNPPEAAARPILEFLNSEPIETFSESRFS